MEVPKSLMHEKEKKEEKQTLEALSSAHGRSLVKRQLVQTRYISNELSLSCLRYVINILLTELSQSVWENPNLGLVYRPTGQTERCESLRSV